MQQRRLEKAAKASELFCRVRVRCCRGFVGVGLLAEPAALLGLFSLLGLLCLVRFFLIGSEHRQDFQ